MKNRQLCAFDMRVDDLDDQGRAFLYLLPDAQMRCATAQQGGLQRQCVKSAQQLIQVIQVILTLLSQRFLATVKVVQFSARAVQIVPARDRASQRGLARGRPLRSRRCRRSSAQEQALPEVVLSIVRSYAWATNRRGDRRSADHVAASSTGASPFALTSAPAPRHATISVAKTSLW